MRTSTVNSEGIANMFKRSHWWREGKEFRANDVASFCKVNKYAAGMAIRVMGAHQLGNHLYQARKPNTLARTQWRKPLEWDGDHTPKYC